MNACRQKTHKKAASVIYQSTNGVTVLLISEVENPVKPSQPP